MLVQALLGDSVYMDRWMNREEWKGWMERGMCQVSGADGSLSNLHFWQKTLRFFLDRGFPYFTVTTLLTSKIWTSLRKISLVWILLGIPWHDHLPIPLDQPGIWFKTSTLNPLPLLLLLLSRPLTAQFKWLVSSCNLQSNIQFLKSWCEAMSLTQLPSGSHFSFPPSWFPSPTSSTPTPLGILPSAVPSTRPKRGSQMHRPIKVLNLNEVLASASNPAAS